MAKLEHLSASEGYTVCVQDFDPSGENPCVLFLLRHEQQQWLKQFEPTIVFVDSTHGTNSYNLQLFTAAIPCEARQGLPAAFCLIYIPDDPCAMQAAVSIFIPQLYLHNPELNPAAFMLDKDQSEHYATGSVIVERALNALEDSIAQLDSLSSDQFEQMWSACTAKAQKQSMQYPSNIVRPLPASPSAPAAAHAAATLAATTTAASSITVATPAALAATVGTVSAATAATDRTSSLCVDAYLAYLAARAKQDVAFVLPPSALHGNCNIPVRPTAVAYQAALLAAAQAFKCNLQSVAIQYAEHTSQASAWRLYLLYRSHFVLLHETVPVLASFCKQFLRTVSLLCWFHVKQAWDENGKAKKQPKAQWPEMYGKLEKIMYAKTKVLQLVTAFVQRYQESQPAAVKYLQDNWFCQEWICQWGMVNQRPGALVDILVGMPGDADAMQASLLNYYLKRIKELARHITTVGNNPVNVCQDTPVDLQQHAVYAAGNCSPAEAGIAICYKAELTSLFKSPEATLGDLSAPYAAATMSSLCCVCADAATAKGVVIDPPIDSNIVPGSHVDVVG
ncbi:TPA: hypothetical protein ACH3X2_006816 [Trebouxia sp. C0005]